MMFALIEFLEEITDYIGKHMRKVFIVVAIICVVVYWSEITAFVGGSTKDASSSVTQWLVDHTPKK